MLDTDGSNRVTLAEFLQLVTVLKVQWEEEEVVTALERHWPLLFHSSMFQAIRRWVLSDSFQYGACLAPLCGGVVVGHLVGVGHLIVACRSAACSKTVRAQQPCPPPLPSRPRTLILRGGTELSVWSVLKRRQGAGCDVTVFFMCVATVWETVSRLHEGREPAPTEVDGKIDSFWDVLELVFTIFFALEVLLKVFVYSWRAYWREFTNRCAQPTPQIGQPVQLLR